MKAEINCPILTNEKFSKEVLGDLVTSLEQLENTKATIFNRLNNAISERVTKLCNIKARINRANQIIANYSSINEAITIKSKKHYPNQKHNYYTSMIIDKNATTLQRPPNEKINKIVINEKENLGFKSLAAKEKIVTYDKFLSFATQFDDIVNTLDKVIAQESSVRQCMDDFSPILKHVTNDFSLANKNKIEQAKKKLAFPRDTGSSISRVGSTVVTEFFNERKTENEKKKKKVIQQAPKSIIEKTKLKKYKKKKKYLATSTQSKINFNLPTNIGLGNVTDLADADDEEDKIEQEKSEDEDDDDYDDDKDDQQTDPQTQDQQDINIDLPIDVIRYNNETKTKIPKNTINTNNNNNNIQQNNNNTINTDNSNNNNNVPNPPPTPPPQQTVATPPPQVPVSTPTTQSDPGVVFVSGGSMPGPPPPPPPPMIKVEFNPEFEKKAKENEEKEKEEKKEEVVQNEGGEEMSMADQIAQSMAKLKKTGEVKIKEPEKPKELSFAEQIALQRNKLKKTVEVKQNPPEKKKVNGMDLLSAQIRLRFQNLRLHEQDDDKDEDSDDSF